MSHFLNGNRNSSNVFLTQAANAGESLPTMEQINDVSIIQPLLSGQVLVFNGEIWQNLVPQKFDKRYYGFTFRYQYIFFTKCTIYIIFNNITKMDKNKYHRIKRNKFSK